MLAVKAFWLNKLWLPLRRAFTGFVPIRYIKGFALVKRNGNIIRKLTPFKVFEVERQTQAVERKTNERMTRIKPKWEIKIMRNGKKVCHKKRIRDLLVWRGQTILAYLLSQGVVGTATASWKVVASENEDAPDMGDDSGDPEANEFNPLIGTPADATYDFNPTVKVSGGYQTYADLVIKGTVVSDGSKTLRKIGIIDTVTVPNRHIVVADSVVPFSVLLNDEIYIEYTVQLG